MSKQFKDKAITANDDYTSDDGGDEESRDFSREEDDVPSDDDDDDDDDDIPEEQENVLDEWEQDDDDAAQTCDLCKQPFTPVGCYGDYHCRRRRPMSKMLFEVDGCHATTNNVTFDRHIRGLACKCAKEARKRGYKVFGLQKFRQCWSGPRASKNFKINRPRKRCYNANKEKCNATRDTLCVGGRRVNYVYRLKPISKSAVKYTKVGCFKDVIEARTLPIMIDNHRDIHSKYYHGVILNWKKFQQTLETLIAHCATKAKANGFKYFGMQYFGECWSSEDPTPPYQKYGASKHCVNAQFKQCDLTKDCICIGKQNVNFVYKLD